MSFQYIPEFIFKFTVIQSYVHPCVWFCVRILSLDFSKLLAPSATNVQASFYWVHIASSNVVLSLKSPKVKDHPATSIIMLFSFWFRPHQHEIGRAGPWIRFLRFPGFISSLYHEAKCPWHCIHETVKSRYWAFDAALVRTRTLTTNVRALGYLQTSDRLEHIVHLLKRYSITKTRCLTVCFTLRAPHEVSPILPFYLSL